jgi:hypothetical protein
LSFFGFDTDAAVIFTASLPFFGPFFPCLSGTAMMASLPQMFSELSRRLAD